MSPKIEFRSWFFHGTISPQIYISHKWGFTKWERDVYEEMRADGRLVPDGVNVQYKPPHGPLQKWKDAQKA